MNSPSDVTTLRYGTALERAHAAVILLHGRGSSGHDMAELAQALAADGIAFLAPSAADGTWYPNRFLAPLASNEPWLSQGLRAIGSLIREAEATGVPRERIGLVGFSQGACLALEYAFRHPDRFAFVAGLSGALIGPIDSPRPVIDMKQTPVLIACAESDSHIPLPFVQESAAVFARSKASVTRQVYAGAAHALFPGELEWLRARIGELAVRV
ncbi:MAG: dienelactone hydrolase family protein [Opitutaceae bacterium]|nr:dienelactone hydrolase family protein [Opitutaceae bacterium]